MKLEHKIIKSKYKDRTIALYIAFAAMTLFSLYIPIIGFISAILLSYYILNILQKFSIIERLALAILFVFIENIVLFTFVTLCNISLDIVLVFPILSAANLLVIFLFRDKFTNLSLRLSSLPTKSDIISTSIALFVFILLLVPIINQSGSYIAQFLSYGEDNASHYALTKYSYENGDFSYFKNADEVGLVKSLEIYPQGFHATAASLIGLTTPKTISESGFIKVYAIIISAIFSFMIFWIIKLVILRSKISWLSVLSLLPAITLLAGLSNLLTLLTRGFQAQIFSYVFLFALLFLLSTSTEKKPFKILLICFALCIGIGTSLWLLLPVVAVLLVHFIFYHWKLQECIRFIKKMWLFITLAAISIALPILVNLALSDKMDPLTEQGGVDKIPLTMFLYTLPFLLLLIPGKLYKKSSNKYLVLSLVLFMTLAGAVAILQMIKIDHLEYFYFKLLYPIYILLLILAGRVALLYIDKLLKIIPKFYKLIPMLIILLITLIISMRANAVYAKVYTHNWYPHAVETDDIGVLFTPEVERYDDVIYIGDCVVGSDYLSNRWSGARLMSENNLRHKFEIAQIYSMEEKTIKYLASYLERSQNILLVVDTRCANDLPGLSKITTSPNVTLQYTHTIQKTDPQ